MPRPTPAPPVEIRHEPASTLAEYARVPIAFEVREVLAVVAPDAGLGGLHLVAAPVAVPYVKDYDAEPGQHPTRWPAHFDTSGWGILSAWLAGERVGGAVVAWDTAGLDLMDGRADLAVLWDLRVAPARRGQGIGAALLAAAERWAAAQGARWLSVETQNVNVPACRFYARHGCTLGAMHRHAYPTLPHETQLRWYKALAAPGG
jgi:GNAT superfamily N-acetyltransferase